VIVASARGETTPAMRDAFNVPWKSKSPTRPSDWGEQVYALGDQADFLRINRQNGVFLMGGTPSTRPHRRYPDGTSLNANEVRESLSIPLALMSWSQAEAAAAGRSAPGRAATTATALALTIPKANKASLRVELEDDGLSWAYLFPDAEGLRDRGPITSRLIGSS
jgi:hypothetical protein